MRRNSWRVLILLSAALSGCTQSILVTPPRTGLEAAPASVSTENVWKSHYLLGFVGRSQLDLRDHCFGGSVVSVSVGQNALTVLLWVVTTGIYTPQRVSIRCAAAAAPNGDDA